MEPRRNRRWTVGIGLTIAIVGLLVLAQKRNHAGAEIVASAFINAVQSGNFAEAAGCWRNGDVANIEANWELPFDQFCVRYFKCERFTLSPPRRDKKSLVIFFEGVEGGHTKKFGLFLRRIDGRWRLIEDKWLE